MFPVRGTYVARATVASVPRNGGMTARRRTGRRGNVEGSIYQLPDGRWRGSVFLGYREGRPHRKYVTRRTRAVVAAEIRRLLEAQRQGQLITTGTVTVGEWLATYLEQRPGKEEVVQQPNTASSSTADDCFKLPPIADLPSGRATSLPGVRSEESGDASGKGGHVRDLEAGP